MLQPHHLIVYVTMVAQSPHNGLVYCKISHIVVCKCMDGRGWGIWKKEHVWRQEGVERK